jgi:hypothetical protein
MLILQTLLCLQSCPFLTVEEHSGETANTDVQGCTNPRQQVTKFCVVAPNISVELASWLCFGT